MNKVDCFDKLTIRQIKYCLICDGNFSFFQKYIIKSNSTITCNHCESNYYFNYGVKLTNKLNYIIFSIDIDNQIIIYNRSDIQVYKNKDFTRIDMPYTLINSLSNYYKNNLISKFFNTILLLK